MWIIPNNYPLYSVFAQDMGVSREDLSLLGLDIESSLMWRSKPSPLPTWLRRWKRLSWLPHLFGRILKPSQWNAFETELALSLGDIPASHFPLPESEQEKMIPGTSGLTSGTSFKQSDLFAFSSKTSSATFRLDCRQSYPTWRKMVIAQNGEYLARQKSVRRTKENGCLLWPTPSAHEARLGYQRRDTNKKGTQESLTTVVINREGGREKCTGQLNLEFCEWLMGVKIGLTDLGSWGTESCRKPQQKPGGC